MCASGMGQNRNDQAAAFELQVPGDVQHEKIYGMALQALPDLPHAVDNVNLGVQDKPFLPPHQVEPDFERGAGIVLVDMVEFLFARDSIEARVPESVGLDAGGSSGSVLLRHGRPKRDHPSEQRDSQGNLPRAAHAVSTSPCRGPPGLSSAAVAGPGPSGRDGAEPDSRL